MPGYPDIAVSLTRQSLGRALELRNRYQLIELRLDQLGWSAMEVSTFLQASSRQENRSSKTIITDRDCKDDKAADLLDAVDWSMVDYLDLDIYDFPDRSQAWISAARLQEVKIIRSHHDYENWVDPVQFIAEHQDAIEQADIIKIASHCSTPEQASATLAAYGSTELSEVYIGMGPAGQITRIQAVDHGAVWSYAFPAGEDSAAPGQLAAESLDLARHMLHSDHQLHGVIGHPVLHSKGPLIFQKYFDDNHLQHHYLRFAMASLEEIDQWYFLPRGVYNVTAPYKYDASAFAGHGSDTPSNILYTSQGKWSRENSDPIGILHALAEKTADLDRAHALVVGSGGAADSACLALRDTCASLTICARNDHTRQALAQRHQAQHSPWSELQSCLDAADVVVWTVPGSAWPKELKLTDSHIILLDANYADRLPAAVQSGTTYLPGESWLYHQATVLMDRMADKGVRHGEDYVAMLQESVDRPSSIALIGLPASGKTTVAELLSAHLQWELVDMDTELAKRAGKSIAAIWKEDGEAVFRDSESALLQELAQHEQVVISTGGGIITRPANRLALQAHSCVWLALDPAQAAQRTHGTDRPLLDTEHRVDRMIHLHHQRYPHYASCSDLVIHAGLYSPEHIAQRLYEEYSKLL